MSYDNETLPVPYLQVDLNGNIIRYSRKALDYFDLNEKKLHDLADQESLQKLSRFIFSSREDRKMELNLKTRQSPLSLFEVHAAWQDEKTCQLVLMPLDNANQSLELQLMKLQQRLSDTNFELFEKKELLEKAIERLNRLSGPFIPVLKGMALVPLFGDITEEKMQVIMDHIIKSAYESEIEMILFDFNAIGKIDSGGVRKLHELFQTLIYIGNPTLKITGVKPNHAKELKNYGLTLPVQFESSLKQSLADYLKVH